MNEVKSLIRDVPDFPKPGILFKDITPVLNHPKAFQSLVIHLAELVPPGTTRLASIESRGFILGAAVAHKLGLGMTLIRKPGKLPSKTISYSYQLEYGSDTLEIHADALDSTDKVCIIDDVLATGGTASAAELLCAKAGSKISGFAFMMELGFLKGREKLKAPVQSLISL